MNTHPKKLKRVPLKEELAALTGDFIKALILQQFLYWSERVSDFDDFILEEKERSPELELELRHGWIYKSTEQLHDELMFGDSLSPRTVKRRLDDIVNSGYLVSRNNPNHKWDRCLQYRPDIIKIQTNLQEIGYALEGYPLFIPAPPFDTVSNASVTVSNQTDIETNRTVASVRAIPEITPEITPESLKDSGADAQPPVFEKPVSKLSIPKIKETKLTVAQWQQWLEDEKTERKRTGVIDFIEKKLHTPAAVKVFQEVVFRWPSKTVWEDIQESVGGTQESLDLWRGILKTWVKRGYNPMNLDGQLESFKKGSLDAQANGHLNGSGRPPNLTDEEWKNYQDLVKTEGSAG